MDGYISHLLLRDGLHVFVIEGQPLAVALDEAHVVAVVGTAAHVHHHREQNVGSIAVLGVICRKDSGWALP